MPHSFARLRTSLTACRAASSDSRGGEPGDKQRDEAGHAGNLNGACSWSRLFWHRDVQLVRPLLDVAGGVLGTGAQLPVTGFQIGQARLPLGKVGRQGLRLLTVDD